MIHWHPLPRTVVILLGEGESPDHDQNNYSYGLSPRSNLWHWPRECEGLPGYPEMSQTAALVASHKTQHTARTYERPPSRGRQAKTGCFCITSSINCPLKGKERRLFKWRRVRIGRFVCLVAQGHWTTWLGIWAWPDTWLASRNRHSSWQSPDFLSCFPSRCLPSPL